MSPTLSPLTSLAHIQERIVTCTQCPRLATYVRDVAVQKVRRFRDETYWGRPVPSFGDAQARLLILGLAPAAHGGNRTGRAFTGDRSGEWLYAALHAHGFASQPTATHRHDGLMLQDCYIAQVLHCAPPANKPERAEVQNCQAYLLAELQLLTQVQIIVPLGHIAFDAYLRACQQLAIPLPEPRPHFGHGALCRLPNGQTLLPSYHPSQQNTSTGRLTRAMLDTIFATARSLLV
ncbi:MAG: uracil-DNA glycosylase [Candidatus Tectomicrobia bacterium]|uniref:Type-5 uracil-DNA glycosylase n=1 Tax=Tectimicrobiota bacterium TaxID=2528274 RepID=A0A938B3P0_UNCTE|nr:uracil-DNA glycosylase [Candidatus Tectomicrobia bacterium]